MTLLSIHLTFAGDCEEAFRFYARTLGGTDLTLVRYGDTPAAAEVPADWRDRLVHASLTVAGHRLAGADVATAAYARPQGFYVLLTAATHAEAERLFAALADGGTIHMPLQPTFWSPAFGVLVDRWGTPWEIMAPAP